jgi:thioester reductase-like protein
MIAGGVDRGACRLDDFFARFVKGIVQLRMCPEIDATIDLAPADYVAQKIVALSRKGGAHTFHLTHPKPVVYIDLVETIRRHGYELKVVPYFRWNQAISEMRYEDGNALYPLLPIFTESMAPFLRHSKLDVTNATGIDSRVPPPVPELLGLYIERFLARGFLSPPAQSPSAKRKVRTSDERRRLDNRMAARNSRLGTVRK